MDASASPRTGVRTNLLRVGVALLLIAGLFIVAPAVYSGVRGSEARRESVRVLSAAADPAMLEEAVGRLGVVLTIGEGPEWIAIRYRDSHSWPGYSSAVARCSDGMWFRSSVHYCGLFSHYRSMRTELQEVMEEDEETRSFYATRFEELAASPIGMIERAATFEEAKGLLRGMGFRELRVR